MNMFVALSPAYSVRNEENASFLTRVVTIIDGNDDSFGTFCIPPFIGYILAHIGDEEYSKSIENISKVLGISFDAIKNFTDQLIENSEKKEFKFSDTNSIILPAEVLISYTDKPNPSVYEETNFNPLGEYAECRPSVPLYANFMVTTACTTDCLYCYANRTLNPILETDKILEVIKELHDQGTVNVMLTGGDILAHKDWTVILRYARKYGYKPYLSTKTPIDKDKISLLKELGYDEIQFSLDSCEPKVLSELIKVDSNYLDRVLQFLRDCSELNFNVLIRSVLTKRNASRQQLTDLYYYLSQFDCVKEWDMTPAFFSKYKEGYYRSLEVDNDDLISAYELSQRNDLAFKIVLNKISEDGYVLKKHEDVEEFVCRNQICMANTTGISILANGNCSVCEMLYDTPEYILGNVKEKSIREIWNSEKALALYTMKQEEFPKTSPCSVCAVFKKCRNDFGKRVCYLDIAKSGYSKYDPDPRCPHADDVNLIL